MMNFDLLPIERNGSRKSIWKIATMMKFYDVLIVPDNNIRHSFFDENIFWQFISVLAAASLVFSFMILLLLVCFSSLVCVCVCIVLLLFMSFEWLVKRAPQRHVSFFVWRWTKKKKNRNSVNYVVDEASQRDI